MTSMHSDIASSRPFGVAEGLGSAELDETTVFSRPVILTGEHATLVTQNGQWCLLDSLRLLSRIVGPLTILLPEGLGLFEDEVRRLAKSVWTKGNVLVVRAGVPVSWTSATAILSVGTRVDEQLPWTCINSNGWVARVSSGPLPLPGDSEQSNPVAALMAASLGVTEVFKRVYGIPHDRAPLLDATQFSLFELSAAPTSIGPPLPPSLTLPDTVLVGGGAIGNGITLLISQLALQGWLHIIDKQTFQRENYGTCVLLDDPAWIGESKAEQLAAWLGQPEGLRCTGEKAFVQEARSGKFVRKMVVDLVLNGLDDIGARHDAQRLWPSVLVDGGINAVGAGVLTQRLSHPEGACMICSFRAPRVNERMQQSKATGLSIESLSTDLNRQLTEQDILQAQPLQRDWLRSQLTQGKTICATISEAQSRTLGLMTEDGFSPSVPFVATASAALVVAQALKSLFFPGSNFTQRFQMESLFLGPEASVGVLTRADLTCECVVHRRLIEKVASDRRRARRQ
ncbi:MAG: ThiF family adenylyltransferase [Piscinibacter sp.]|uniref:hypothetical protein n=1 Tax=Piscinibacter sp. TaxID=1903157 RepID=UPI00258EF729|nr:hypothetical protein [Piscinibacter sp.]MCW5667826.1 ThiF family adenylyltransferase [Piscinibacter sp.]